MTPDTSPPDDERSPTSGEGNVVDSGVLAERRAQRAEQAEQSAARRAADAQVLAASLARERARLEAERDAARAEAAAAREGADAAIAEAAHVQAERDTLRDALTEARKERDAACAERDAAVAQADDAAAAAPVVSAAAPVAPEPSQVAASAAGSRNGVARNGASTPPIAWPAALRRELAVARGAAPAPVAAAAGPTGDEPSPIVPGLARERRLVARRAAEPPPMPRAVVPDARGGGDRAAPVTALALERERSSRLQAQLDRAFAVEQELRGQLAALEQAVRERIEAEQRIETALRRVREELTAATELAAEQTAAAPGPDPAPDPDPPADAHAADPASRAAAHADPPAAPAAAPASASERAPSAVAALDPVRLSAARERLRAAVAAEQAPEPLPMGEAAPWLTAALQRLLETEPETAGRLAVGLLPAQGLAATAPLRYDLLLAGHGCVAVDVEPGAASTQLRSAPRPRSAVDLRVTSDHAGFARLLHGKRRLRRSARVRGSRRQLRELRRLARAPLGLRDVASAGVALDPALALRLVALAIDPAETNGHRFAIAHAPLAGGPVDAWLRIAYGEPPAVVDAAPAEPVLLTLRCTRGALLPLIAGVAPPPGESGSVDGDQTLLALLRGWIAATERTGA